MLTYTSRLESALRAKNDLKLVPYIMAGHPTAKKSIEVGRKLAASGVAAIEIGIPHSDPLADGPVIQRAGQVALENGMTVAGGLAAARRGAPASVPVACVRHAPPPRLAAGRGGVGGGGRRGGGGGGHPPPPSRSKRPSRSRR